MARYDANAALSIEKKVHVGAQVLGLEIREPEAKTEATEEETVQNDVDDVLTICDSIIVTTVFFH